MKKKKERTIVALTRFEDVLTRLRHTERRQNRSTGAPPTQTIWKNNGVLFRPVSCQTNRSLSHCRQKVDAQLEEGSFSLFGGEKEEEREGEGGGRNLQKKKEEENTLKTQFQKADLSLSIKQEET